MKKKVVNFSPITKVGEKIHPFPKPAVNFIPEWYKKMPQFNVKDEHTSSATAKLCSPVLDSLTGGYMILLSAAINVKIINGEQRIDFRTSWQPLDVQEHGTYPGYPIPTGFNSTVFRWQNHWKFETPSGYSSMIMHPNHRYDLPFLTLSSVVDTDVLPNPIVFPFFLKENFEGIIPEGTPIAQLVPFKREQWDSQVNAFDEKNIYGSDFIAQGYLRTYKNKLWHKKNYN
jgi:hypothetical protein